MKKSFREDFYKLKSKLETGENFSFSRFSDGDMYILQNKKLVLDNGLIQIGNNTQTGPYKKQDFKNFDPEIHSFYRDRLIEAYKHKQKNYYKGISCACCVGKDNFDWQLELHGGDDESLSWANLWVNGNYPIFMSEMMPIIQTKPCVFIGHQDADLSNFEIFVKDFRVGYNAMINDYPKIENILEWIKTENISNHLFLFSASTFSNLAIHKLFSNCPNNTYIDIGTTLAPIMKMPSERGYLQSYWFGMPGEDLKRICIWN